jgi:hypothetical protein
MIHTLLRQIQGTTRQTHQRQHLDEFQEEQTVPSYLKIKKAVPSLEGRDTRLI